MQARGGLPVGGRVGRPRRDGLGFLLDEAALGGGVAQLLPDGQVVDLQLVAQRGAGAAHGAVPQLSLIHI